MVVAELQKGEPQCANTEVPSVTHLMMSSWSKQIIWQSGSDGKESTCNVGDLGWEVPLEGAWQPTPVFLPGESPWTEKPGGLKELDTTE